MLKRSFLWGTVLVSKILLISTEIAAYTYTPEGIVIELPESVDLYSAGGFESFGNYTRAITEYHRYFFHKKDNLTDEQKTALNSYIGDIYTYSGNYEKAAEYYQRAGNNIKKSSHFRPFEFALALRRMQLQQLKGHDLSADIISLRSKIPEKMQLVSDDRLRMLLIRYLLHNERQRSAEALLENPFYTDEYNMVADRLKHQLQEPYRQYSYYNMAFTVVPGLGYFAIEEPSLGFKSFATVTVLSLAAWAAIKKGFDITGLFLGLMGVRYYADSIATTYSKLKEKNHEFRKEYYRQAIYTAGGAPDFTAHIAIKLRFF